MARRRFSPTDSGNRARRARHFVPAPWNAGGRSGRLGGMVSGYVVEPGPDTLRGWFSREYAPVLSVDPGESVRFRTLDCWWSAGPYEGGTPRDRKRVPEYVEGAGHALCGPVEVRGARPGGVLEVRIDRVRPGR